MFTICHSNNDDLEHFRVIHGHNDSNSIDKASDTLMFEIQARVNLNGRSHLRVQRRDRAHTQLATQSLFHHLNLIYSTDNEPVFDFNF